MPTRSLDAVFFVAAAPEVEIIDGLFHVTFDIGSQARFELVMLPNTFLKLRRASGNVVAKFHSGERNVLSFGGNAKASDGGAH